MLVVVLLVAAGVQRVALLSLDRPHAPSPTPPPTAIAPPTSELSEVQLEQALVRLSDLPAGWRESYPPAGAVGLDADELCGRKPRADTRVEVNASFTGGPPSRFNGQLFGALNLYSTIGGFASPQAAASGFLTQVGRQFNAGQPTGWAGSPADSSPTPPMLSPPSSS